MRYVCLFGLLGDLIIENDPEYLIYILGGNSDEVPPLPIPNREVKLVSADGIALTM